MMIDPAVKDWLAGGEDMGPIEILLRDGTMYMNTPFTGWVSASLDDLGIGAAALTDATLLQSVLVLLQTTGFVTVVLMLMFVERPALPPDRPAA